MSPFAGGSFPQCLPTMRLSLNSTDAIGIRVGTPLPGDAMSNDHPSSNTSTASERKLAANRANAQRSTGPRTPQGKARASLNALRHGILAKAAFNSTLESKERRAEFEAIVAGFADEFQPQTLS